MNDRTSQMIQDMARQVEEQLINVETQVQEFERILQDIDEYTKIETGSEIMAPISNGIFIKAKALDTNMFIINVGGNVMVEKTPEKTKEMISRQVEELQKYRDELVGQLEKANQSMGR